MVRVQRSGLVLLWAVATSVTTAIAFWAVSTADSEVSDRPLTAVVASTPITSPSTLPPQTATTSGAGTMAPAPSSQTTTSEGSVVATAWTRTTLNSEGGSIIVSYRPSEVRLESVAPLAGFSFEIDDEGPERVRVEFFGEDETHTLRAEWTGEGFVTEVGQSGEGADD